MRTQPDALFGSQPQHVHIFIVPSSFDNGTGWVCSFTGLFFGRSRNKNLGLPARPQMDFVAMSKSRLAIKYWIYSLCVYIVAAATEPMRL